MIISIKQASIKDIPLIRRLASIAFPATYKPILSEAQLDYMMNWMYSSESLHRQIKEEGHVYFIAYGDEEPCGYVSVQQESSDLFHLQKIYVLPGMQGHHIGRLLFGKAVEYIKDIHPEPCTMELNVNRSNKAVAFYEHLGMHKVREEDSPIGDGYYMNDYIMGVEI